jgi:hypothetical protein
MLREMIGEDSKLMVEAAPRAQKCTQEEWFSRAWKAWEKDKKSLSYTLNRKTQPVPYVKPRVLGFCYMFPWNPTICKNCYDMTVGAKRPTNHLA